jgi:hypothetical protein
MCRIGRSPLRPHLGFDGVNLFQNFGPVAFRNAGRRYRPCLRPRIRLRLGCLLSPQPR